MAWIESHTVLSRHRKLKELALLLRLKPVHLMGHLHALWHDALEQQEDGDLSAWSDELIAESAQFDGDAPKFVSLLQDRGWLDGRLIHDWLDYAGRYLEGKYRSSDPERLRQIWNVHGKDWDGKPGRQMPPGWGAIRLRILKRDNFICKYCGKTEAHMEVDHVIPASKGGSDEESNLVASCRGCNRDKKDKPAISLTKASPPDLTRPDLTKPTVKAAQAPARFIKPMAKEVSEYGKSIGFSIDGQSFCDFYESKGWKVGQTAMKDWRAAVRTWKKRDSLPARGEVVASHPGISLKPGQDPWKSEEE